MEAPSGSAYGFDLGKICWGYRDIFKRIIEDLFRQGHLGQHKRQVTEKFFSVLESENQQLFDHVLKEFLEAVAGNSSWIFDIPAIFEEVIDLGIQFADSRLHYGITYFRILSQGRFGSTPSQVRHLISCIRRLLPADSELAFAFLHGYGKLLPRLSPQEINLYLAEGLRLFNRNRESARQFLAVTLRSSEAIIRSLSHECRLLDMAPWMARLLKALAGYPVDIDDLKTQSKKMEEERAQLQQERNALVPEVHPDQINLYKKIADKNNGLALSPVTDDFCSMCHMRIRPQMINELKAETEIILCENCGRILYWWDNHPDSDQSA